MQLAGDVRGVKPIADLRDHVRGEAERDPLAALEQPPDQAREVLALEVFHDPIEVLADLDDLDDLDEVRMARRRSSTDPMRDLLDRDGLARRTLAEQDLTAVAADGDPAEDLVRADHGTSL